MKKLFLATLALSTLSMSAFAEKVNTKQDIVINATVADSIKITTLASTVNIDVDAKSGGITDTAIGVQMQGASADNPRTYSISIGGEQARDDMPDMYALKNASGDVLPMRVGFKDESGNDVVIFPNKPADAVTKNGDGSDQAYFKLSVRAEDAKSVKADDYTATLNVQIAAK